MNFSLQNILTGFVFLSSTLSCKSMEPSASKGEKGTAYGLMITGEGIFDVVFLPEAFEDGMDINFHGSKFQINFKSASDGLKFSCSDDFCMLSLDANSPDFISSAYKAEKSLAGFEVILNSISPVLNFGTLPCPANL